MPTADAIVVLSEGRVVAPGVAAMSEWTDGDRFWGGIALYQAGKAPMLVFTGGGAPWQPNAKPEGEVLISYAKALGVPSKALRTTGLVVQGARFKGQGARQKTGSRFKAEDRFKGQGSS